MNSFIKNHKIKVAVAVIVIIGIIFALRARGSQNIETVTLTTGDLVRTVELSGKVVSVDDISLAFETGGTIDRVYKKVGDLVYAGEIIVELDRASVEADYLKAEADLQAAEAELSKIAGGNGLRAQVLNSKLDIIQSIKDAYTQANDAVFNKVDQFFTDPRSQNPRIVYAFENLALRDRVNNLRIVAGEALTAWNTLVSKLSPDTYTTVDLEASQGYVKTIAQFLDEVSLAVNSFKANDSVSQTLIDKYRSDTATARINVNNAAGSLITGAKTFANDISDLPIQVARVSSAQAVRASYQAKLARMYLRSPIDGIVSKQDAKIGQSVAPNTVIAGVISPKYKIEAYVPEVNIAGVVPGAKAFVSLDAYGKSVVFETVVDRIEPRETIRDGVSTYKTDFIFSKPDDRIKSGLTANISIETLRKNDVSLIPLRTVSIKNDKKTVTVVVDKKTQETREVILGNEDTKGNVEVISGVTESDVILLNPKP